MSHSPKHIESGAGWITNQFVTWIIYGFVIRIYCKCHWLLENSTVSLSVYFLDNPSSFPVTAETLRTIPRLFFTQSKTRYWTPPFLLWVSFLPAFQLPPSWTCSFFPWNLKSGLNIFAPADVPLGLSLLWFQRNWVCSISRSQWLPALMYDHIGLVLTFKIIWNNNRGGKDVYWICRCKWEGKKVQ